MVPQGITRVVVKERDRSALQGTLPGEGYRLIVEVFIETGAARPHRDVASRHPPAARRRHRPPAVAHPRRRSPRVDRRTASSVAAPARNSSRRKNLVLKSIDFELRLPAGDVFVAETPEGVTALVLRRRRHDGRSSPGRRKSAASSSLFAGAEALETPFTDRVRPPQPVRIRAARGRRHAGAGGARQPRVPARPERVRRRRAEVVQSRSERSEPRRLVAAAAARRLRRRGARRAASTI